MKLSFNRLLVEGFKSFKNQAAFRINVGPGLHFLEGNNKTAARLGSNGSGKSTLWDAITWCLYGRTVSGLRNVDVKPWAYKGPTRVQLGISVDDTKHIIARTLGSKAVITIDGQEVGQEAVEDLVGMSLPVFENAILHGQGRPLFYDLSATDKLALFSEVMQLQRWDDRAKLAATRHAERKLKAERNSARIEALNETLEGLRADLASLKERRDEALAEAEAKGERAARKLKPLRARLEELMRKRDDADLAYDGAGTEMRMIEREMKELQDLRFAQIQEQNKYGIAIEQAQRNVATLTKQRDKLKEAGTCPTCGQKIKGSTTEHRTELDTALRKEQRIIDRGIPSAITSALADLDKQVKANWRTNKELEQKRDHAEAALNLAKEQVAEVKKQIAIIEAVQAEADAAPDQLTAMLKQLRSRIASTKAEAEQAEDERIRDERVASRYQYWAKAFKQVKLFEIDELLTELQLTTNVLLPELGLDGWRVEYSVERESRAGNVTRGLRVLVASPTSDRLVRWESWSGGEGQRLRLVGSLALAEALLNYSGIDCGLEVLDEPTQHMSVAGVQDLIEQIAERAKRRGAVIWLADHMAMPSARFASAARVVKGSKGSRIVQPA